MEFISILDELIELTRKAGKAVLEVYDSDFIGVEVKNDNSPLTQADLISNKILTDGLTKYQYPILSEESKKVPYKDRKDWKGFWCVDPIDGTKEFIKKTGEFTINIAFLENNVPVFGIVYVPVIDKLYVGGKNLLPFCLDRGQKIILKNRLKHQFTNNIAIASKSHINKETKDYIKTLGEDVALISMGSSLKFMLIAEGKANIYPRFVPTMEWDTAASHAILSALGYSIKTVENVELVYNKKNLLNPSFIAG
ncbi:3'(2'),5'-bisphosphate nucleotidase CysQ [Wenyingzhuangia sp. IMCC45533]